MNKWRKISLFQFQQVDAINAQDKSELDKLLFTVCVVFGFTEYQLDNMKLRRATRLINRVKAIFESDFKAKPCTKIGKYTINYDPSTLTFGQYIELSFFLNAPTQKAHYIFASIVDSDATGHRDRMEYFLTQPITKIAGSLSLFIERFKTFNNEYKGLFGLNQEVSGDVQSDEFNKRYGWVYSASQVAEYERITLDDAFGLPVRRALNDLGYLKAKAKYDNEQLKKNK